MPNSFENLFTKHKQKQAVQQQKQPVNLNSLLRGTGITKRASEQAAKIHENANKIESSLQLDEKHPELITLDLNLPSTITDDAIQLDTDQTAALNGLRNQKYGCLIGAAGTGKTTTLKRLIAELEKTVGLIDLNRIRKEEERTNKPDMNIAVCFCSFTGRAVQQIKRVLPQEYHALCNTIHKTLGYMPTAEEYEDKETGEWKERRVFRPTFTAANKLPYKICIVDEAGTVPINLWDELIAALPDDCRILLVGDINQLPPVQGRSVLGFAMTRWPTYTLEKIHRQAEGNPIIANAHRVLTGKKPMTDKKKFIVSEMPSGSLDTYKQAAGIIQHLHRQGLFNPLRDAFIVPQNIGTLGQIHFNEALVKYFNQLKKIDGIPLNPRTIITAGYAHVTFAVGDKVMLLANDNKLGLTNGMIGVVQEIVNNAAFRGESAAAQMTDKFTGEAIDLSDLSAELEDAEEELKHAEEESESERQASHTMRVKFQNTETLVEFVTAGEFKKVAHAYAATCHKSQGGEYHTVVILAHSANLKMLTREWLYTAITRAQERVVLLVNHRGITHAVNNQRIKGKTVAEKAASFLALQDQSDTRVPNLPEPQEV